jgi:hypothetical protein
MQGVEDDRVSKLGETVTIYSFQIDYTNPHGQGAEGSYSSTGTSMLMIMNQLITRALSSEEGLMQLTRWNGQVQHDANINIKDMVVRADGMKFYVTEKWDTKANDVVTARWVRLEAKPVNPL